MTHISPFKGSIPEHYDHYLGPMFFEPYAVEVVRHIDPSSVSVALEIGAGTGVVTRHLRNKLSETTKLIASDISPDMLEIAKEKLKGQNIEWRIIDATELPFKDNSIDLVVCCFAYMFVEDKSKAFSEAYRVLRPGGMFLFTTWDKLELNEASYTFRTIVKEYLTDPVPPNYKLPFAFNDQDEMTRMLNKAGFSEVSIESVEKLSVCSTAKEAATGLARGGSLYQEIMNRNPAWIEEISEKLEKELTRKYGDASISAPMRAVICEAIATKL